MIAVDTNVIVRLIVGDDRDQVERALRLLEQTDVFVSLTVLLETEWVLRSRFGMDRTAIVDAMRAVADLSSIVIEADDDVQWALARYAKGGEFADFIHLAATRPVGRFVTFDRKLARLGDRDCPIPIELVP